ncbi:MAG: hypothetical protein M1837_002494 [Sclerophora amabilis]|nr:MAG: hypothetical protein M1837_002494 [Sclerophora amabilis]
MKTPKRNLEECIVCREVKPRWFIRRLVGRSAFPLRADFPKSCRHDPPMCKTCIARSLEMILMSKGPEKMGCPQCPELWSVKYIQKFASPEVFEKYSRFRLHRVLATTPNFCLCASPTCESGQVHPDGAESPLMICKQCGFKTCFVHQRPWHPAFTCEQIDEQDREHNKASLRWIQKSAKKCPGIGCGWLIEKVQDAIINGATNVSPTPGTS